MERFVEQRIAPEIPPYERTNRWYAKWLTIPCCVPPFVGCFSLSFSLEQSREFTLHVAGGDRYELYLDDQLLGRGSEMGDLYTCFYETYQVFAQKGEHRLMARVWSADAQAGEDPILRRGMFLLAADDPADNHLFTTGIAPWLCCKQKGYEFIDFSKQGIITGKRIRYTPSARMNDWQTPVCLAAGYKPFAYQISDRWPMLVPSTVRFMPETLFFDQTFTLMPGQQLAVPLNQYYCFYFEAEIEGQPGDEIQIYSSEQADTMSYGDAFVLGSSACETVQSLDWLAGCFVRLTSLGKHPIRLRLRLFETRAFFEQQSTLSFENTAFNRLMPLGVRSIQMCTHDHLMDCPFWERGMYIGDSRLIGLVGYLMHDDNTQIKKTLRFFKESAKNFTGLPTCSCLDHSTKIIPSFCLVWVFTLHDFMLWQNDKEFVRQMIPLARGILFSQYRKDGLVPVPEGWDYYDTTYDEHGVQDEDGVTVLYNLMFVLALEHLAAMERYLDEEHLALSCLEKAQTLMGQIVARYWDGANGLFSDTLEKNRFSQHVQAIALLIDCVPKQIKAQNAQSLICPPVLLQPTNIYFTHYLFDAYYHIGRGDLIASLVDQWAKDVREDAFTLPENWGEARSKCHAWGAHFIYHYCAGVAGIRPASPGFETVSIRPCLEVLGNTNVVLPHPKGKLAFSFDGTTIRTSLPDGVTGTLWLGGEQHPLCGNNEIKLHET